MATLGVQSVHWSRIALDGAMALRAGGGLTRAAYWLQPGQLMPTMPTLPLLHGRWAKAAMTASASGPSTSWSNQDWQPSLAPVPRRLTQATAHPASSQKPRGAVLEWGLVWRPPAEIACSSVNVPAAPFG